jgi:hypothetical protein
MAVGDNAELFVTAQAAVNVDSNIYMGTVAEDDTIFNFTPGLDLVFGKGSATSGNLYYKEEIRRYSNFDEQDTELSSFGLRARYENGKTKADFNALYDQLAQNSSDIQAFRDIVHRDVVNVNGKVEFGISEKSSFSVGAAYEKTDYKKDGYTDSDVLSLPVDFYFQTSPKLDWSAGYRYRTTELAGAAQDSEDHFLNIGARGEFTPKLSGQLRVGYIMRSFDVSGDDDMFGFSGDLTYKYSDKTSYQFNASNDFDSSATGANTEALTIGLRATNNLSEQWSMTAGINYLSTYYSSARTDDYTEVLIGVSYVYNQYVNFSGSFTLRNNSSDVILSEFDQNIFNLAANVRY